MEHTDEEHGLTMKELISALDEYQISAERKSLYDDIEQLRHFGMDIIGEQRDKKFYYYLAGRDFEIAELKLLVDAVQSSKFITEKKSNELIKKLESLTSKYEAVHLQRQVYVKGRVKASNESILYSVDVIHDAISTNRKIRFKYFQWNEKKEKVLRHNGSVYEISPIGLCWDDENYYLVGYDSAASKNKHFRVDKMLEVVITDCQRDKEAFVEGFNMVEYSRKVFAMYEGEETYVKLRFKNDFAGVAIDRFGTDVTFFPAKEKDCFTINVKVHVSNQFLGWIVSLGDGVKILEPETVVEKLKTEAERILKSY